MHFDRRADHGFSDLVHLHRVSLSLFTPVHRMIAILRVFLSVPAPLRSVHKLRLWNNAETPRR